MDDRLVDLIRRRERLLARAETQRGEIAVAVARWRVPLHAADQVLTVLRFLRGHPVLVGAAAAAIAASRPRRFVRWARRGWMVWRLWRSTLLSRWMRGNHS